MDQTDLRLECLQLAIGSGQPHEVVVSAARAYVAFVSNGVDVLPKDIRCRRDPTF
jgi:hypothetical protein